MSTNCTGGQISTLQVNNTDCECVSISQISVNTAGTQVTITLSNGQSLTFTIPTGPAGATITPEFRVSGNYLQYSIDEGANWINLYDLSLLESTQILANQFPNLATLGTSFESLLVGRTPYVLPAATLTADGDEIHVRTVFISTVATSLFGQAVRLTFNGNNIRGTAYTGFYASNIRRIVIDAKITRTSNTTANSEVVVEYFTGTTSDDTNTSVLRTIDKVTAIAGLNFTTTAYNIDAQGDSVVIGDINCQAFEVIKYKI